MVFYLLIVAVANLALGYVLAVLLGHTRALGQAAARIARDDPSTGCHSDPPASEDEPPAAQHPAAEAAEQTTVVQEPADGDGFVESSIRNVTSDVNQYRKHLLEIDAELRRCRQEPQPEWLLATVGDLQQANDDWIRKQGQAIDQLVARHGQLGNWAEVSGNLEQMLMEQAAQTETAFSNIQMLDLQSDPGRVAEHLILEVSRLLDSCHRLRDRMHESLLAIASQGGGLEALDRDGLADPTSGILNRTGLERMLRQWWRDDPSRQASFCIANLDRLGRINEQYGARVGDEVIATVGGVFDESLRRNRGFDVAAWFGEGSFVAFLGDTSPENATCAMERVRQTVAALRVRLGSEEVDVHMTCGVVAVDEGDSSFTLFHKARQAIRAAKRVGRNHTVLQSPDGPIVVEPPPYRIAARVIQLDPACERPA